MLDSLLYTYPWVDASETEMIRKGIRVFKIRGTMLWPIKSHWMPEVYVELLGPNREPSVSANIHLSSKNTQRNIMVIL